jgi:hypothetical protein
MTSAVSLSRALPTLALSALPIAADLLAHRIYQKNLRTLQPILMTAASLAYLQWPHSAQLIKTAFGIAVSPRAIGTAAGTTILLAVASFSSSSRLAAPVLYLAYKAAQYYWTRTSPLPKEKRPAPSLDSEEKDERTESEQAALSEILSGPLSDKLSPALLEKLKGLNTKEGDPTEAELAEVLEMFPDDEEADSKTPPLSAPLPTSGNGSAPLSREPPPSASAPAAATASPSNPALDDMFSAEMRQLEEQAVKRLEAEAVKVKKNRDASLREMLKKAVKIQVKTKITTCAHEKEDEKTHVKTNVPEKLESLDVTFRLYTGHLFHFDKETADWIQKNQKKKVTEKTPFVFVHLGFEESSTSLLNWDYLPLEFLETLTKKKTVLVLESEKRKFEIEFLKAGFQTVSKKLDNITDRTPMKPIVSCVLAYETFGSDQEFKEDKKITGKFTAAIAYLRPLEI